MAAQRKTSGRKDRVDAAIQRDRDLALSILKPTKKQLEHGLALHAESLVVESYCLGLRAPANAKLLAQAAAAGASCVEVRDQVTDMCVAGWAATRQLQDEYRKVRAAAGVTCIFQNAGEEGNDPLVLLKRLSCHSYLVDAMPGVLRRIFSPADIVAAKQDGKYATCLATNGVPLTGNRFSVEEELRLVRVFAHLGVRMMHLTYNRRNPIGDGCGEPKDAGLSDFGRAAVAEMNRHGIMIDIAHSGWNTCVDTAKLSARPVVISHSGAEALNRHVRCKPDSVIAQVVGRGGVMGITNIPAFLGRSGDIVAFLDHIDYVVKKFGAEAVCIGTDTGYASAHESPDVQRLKLPKARSRWESLWPPGDPLRAKRWNRPELRRSMAWTNWPLFTVGLVQRGHTDTTIRKILGENLLRVARAAWEGSSLQPAK